MTKKKLIASSCMLMLAFQLAACSSASDPAAAARSSEQNTSKETFSESTDTADIESPAGNEIVFSNILDVIKYNSVCYYGLNMTIALTDEEEAAKQCIGTVPSVCAPENYPAAELEATETVFNVGDEIYYIETSEYGLCFLKKSATGYTGLTQCTTTAPHYYH